MNYLLGATVLLLALVSQTSSSEDFLVGFVGKLIGARNFFFGGRRAARFWRACYRHVDVDCFSLFSGAMRHTKILPEYPDETTSPKFRLYTEVGGSAQLLNYSDSTTLEGFDGSRKTYFILHGFTESYRQDYFANMREALLKHRGPCNVIPVDWERLAQGPFLNFPQAAANSELVGRMLGNMIRALANKGLSYDNVHLIGHSLGAHAAGHAGRWVQLRENGQKIGRISGLDPAGTMFAPVGHHWFYSAATRLDPTDAGFVDVIHNNAVKMLSGGFGSDLEMGHVDFFQDGSITSYGCEKIPDNSSLCSHKRAAYQYVESIENPSCSLRSFPCAQLTSLSSFDNLYVAGNCFECNGNCGILGIDADQAPGRGRQFLIERGENATQTTDFCGTQVKVTVISAPQTAAEGQLMVNLESEQPSLINFESTTLTGGASYTRVMMAPSVASRSELAVSVSLAGAESWSIIQINAQDDQGTMFYYCSQSTILPTSAFSVTMTKTPC